MLHTKSSDATHYGYIDEGSTKNFDVFRSLNVVTQNNDLYYLCSIVQAINEEYESRAVMIEEYSSPSLRATRRAAVILGENDAVFHYGDGTDPDANKLAEESRNDFLDSVLKATVNPELTLQEFEEQSAMGSRVRWPGEGEKAALV